ncbi:hypothetical protein BH11MYX1_BH11MYX1_13090 [soil metagenome]
MRIALLCLIAGCQRSNDRLIEVARHDWRIHEQVLLAGEQAAACPAAGAAMQVVIKAHLAELSAAVATTAPENIKAVTTFIAAHPTEFPDFDDRWDALRDRCPHDPAVQQAFRDLGLAGLDQTPALALPTPGGSE